MSNTSETTTKTIETMPDTEVLVATALATAKIYGQILEHWEYVAGMYSIFSEDQAALRIEDKLGDEYLLDPDICRDWLITEATYGSVHTA